MNEWHSIETAPKDRWILIWWSSSNVRDASWVDFMGARGWFENQGHIIPEDKPTHWMELPNPPEGPVVPKRKEYPDEA